MRCEYTKTFHGLSQSSLIRHFVAGAVVGTAAGAGAGAGLTVCGVVQVLFVGVFCEGRWFCVRLKNHPAL